MKKSRNSLRNLASGLLIGLVAALWTSAVGAGTGTANLIRGIDVTEHQGATTITVAGSKRPSYTAFRLSSPKRLVVDLANSRVRGVPSILEKATSLIEGVAVSEYSVKGSPVSRVMINFKADASYRVRTKGGDL